MASTDKSPDKPAADRPQMAVQPALDEAVDHHLAGRLDESAAIYRQVLKNSPEHPVALHLIGLIAHQTGRNETALDLISRALAVEPDYYEAHSNLGLVLAELSRLEEAVACHSKALAINSSYAEAHNNLGNVLQTLGRYPEAVASYQTALAIDPASPETTTNLGTALKQLGRPHQAMACYRGALTMAPNSPETLVNLADVLQDLQQLDEAVSVYGKALDTSPNDVDTLGNLAGALNKLSRFDEAAECYAKAFATAPRGGITIMQLYSASQLPLEIAGCDLASLVDQARPGPGDEDEDFESWRGFARASMLHRAGRYDEAWQNLAKANRWPAAQWTQQAARQAESHDGLLNEARAGLFPAPPLTSLVGGERPLVLFILGPSRSGKTALERLVCTTDDARPSHERAVLHEAMRQTCHQAEQSMPTSLKNLPAALTAPFRDIWRQQLAALTGPAQLLTNTNPGYISEVLYASAILPGLRFAFIKRNVDDVTLRIFMKRYRRNNPHAYDVKTIAAYVAWYNDMIDALAERLPDVSAVIRYEDMICEPAEALGSVARLCGAKLPSGPLPQLGDDRGCAVPYARNLNVD